MTEFTVTLLSAEAQVKEHLVGTNYELFITRSTQRTAHKL